MEGRADMSKNPLEGLTDEELELALEEKRRRDEERLKKQEEEYMKRRGIYAYCAKCKIWMTEEEIQRFDRCPKCGHDKVIVI